MKYIVDGHEHDDLDSNLAGDGQFPPFHIFVPDEQDNLPGTYRTREDAQRVADLLNGKRKRLTETETGALGFIARALQTSEVPFHAEPMIYGVNGDGWIEYTLFPEGLFRVRVEHVTGEPIAKPLEPDTPLLDRPIAEVVAPAAPKAEVVVPTPDDPKYTQVFDRMLNIVEEIDLATRLEDSNRYDEAGAVWTGVRADVRRVLEMLKPEPAAPPKQFHSGWSVPPHEAEVTCAGTWLECWTHLDEYLKACQKDGEPYANLAYDARSQLTSWAAYRADKPGWIAFNGEALWIAELPGV